MKRGVVLFHVAQNILNKFGGIVCLFFLFTTWDQFPIQSISEKWTESGMKRDVSEKSKQK